MNTKKIQPSYDTNRKVLGEIYPLSTPFNVVLDASEVCNFRCQYCFRGQSDKTKWGYAEKQSFMEWELFQRAVSQIQEFPDSVKQISLSNHGEPLCNRKVPDMVRYIKQQGIAGRVSIHTNAAMMDEAYAYDLADSNIDRIVVSLQGISSAKYREICATDIDFDDLYKNLTILYQNKKDTQLYFKIMDIALANGEEETFYKLFTPIGDRVYIEKVVPIWKDVDVPAGKGRDEDAIYNKYGEVFPKQDCCPLIFHTIVVSPIGDVYPCTQLLTPYLLGNIKQQTLRELWNCDARKKLLLRQCKKSNPDICKDCYILQNSIYAKEDMIDSYRYEIMDRLLKDEG